MIDSLRLQRGHMGSSPRDCRDDKACIGEGVELWSEQPIETDRCRREVALAPSVSPSVPGRRSRPSVERCACRARPPVPPVRRGLPHPQSETLQATSAHRTAPANSREVVRPSLALVDRRRRLLVHVDRRLVVLVALPGQPAPVHAEHLVSAVALIVPHRVSSVLGVDAGIPLCVPFSATWGFEKRCILGSCQSGPVCRAPSL